MGNFKLNLTFLMLRRFSNFNKTNNTKSFFRNFVYQRTDKPSVFRIINFYDTDHRLSLNQVSPTFYKNEDDSYSLSRSGLIFLNISNPNREFVSYPMSIEQTIQLVLSEPKEIGNEFQRQICRRCHLHTKRRFWFWLC